MFQIVPRFCTSDSVDYDGYSIYSKGFLSTVVDIMVTLINLAIPVHFSSLIPKLAISCLTTSNLPWFIYLIFQVPVQDCSLQHQTLLPLPVASTTGCYFHYGSVSSFFLELFLHWSQVTYWAPTNVRSSYFSVISFWLFILFMGFSRQEYWSGLPSHSQWTIFCQNYLPWPIRLGWPCTAWLIVSLS